MKLDEQYLDALENEFDEAELIVDQALKIEAAVCYTAVVQARFPVVIGGSARMRRSQA